MALPIAPVVLPADLVGQPNGRIDASLLVEVGPSGLLHHTAARAWRALVADAAAVGLPLTYTYGGTYRTLASQRALFESRYSPTGTGGGCKPYQGAMWCKKSSNLATAAVPGTSNHGLGIAIDTAFDSDVTDGIGPDDAMGISSHPHWSWFLANAGRFGFSWELQSEPWHVRYVTGDAIPQAVLAHETPPPIAPPLPPSPERIVMAERFEFTTPYRWDTRAFGVLPVGQYEVKLPATSGKVAVKGNLTVVPAEFAGAGYATAWIGNVPTPDVSSLNWVAAAVANQIDVPLAPDGTFKVYISTPASIIFDLVGFWE